MISKSFYFGILLNLSFDVHAGMEQTYWNDRAKLIKEDQCCSLGSEIILNEDEQKANAVIMKHKCDEINAGFHQPGSFLPAQNFLKVKSAIDQSEVFKIIQKLPKGTSLHSHDMALASGEYLYSLTFEPNLYARIDQGKLKLKFFNATSRDPQWKLVESLRKTDPNFEDFLKSKLTLIVDDPQKAYPDINSVWYSFANIFVTMCEMLSYKPIWQKYFYQALKELYDDNVRYIEFRGLLPDVYDLSGKIYTPLEVVGLYNETLAQFKNDYPDFWGARLIYAPVRHVTNKTMAEYVEIFQELKTNYPNFIAGFDLVGQEDLGEQVFLHVNLNYLRFSFLINFNNKFV